jgi:hypothetical protein
VNAALRLHCFGADQAGFPSGQRGRTVNPLAQPSKVRILLPPPCSTIESPAYAGLSSCLGATHATVTSTVVDHDDSRLARGDGFGLLLPRELSPDERRSLLWRNVRRAYARAVWTRAAVSMESEYRVVILTEPVILHRGCFRTCEPLCFTWPSRCSRTSTSSVDCAPVDPTGSGRMS